MDTKGGSEKDSGWNEDEGFPPDPPRWELDDNPGTYLITIRHTVTKEMNLDIEGTYGRS